MLFQFLRTITPTHDAAMLLSILGLLLAGAEPTSYARPACESFHIVQCVFTFPVISQSDMTYEKVLHLFSLSTSSFFSRSDGQR